MQRVVLVVLGLGGLAVASMYAQAPAEIIERALTAAPNRAREGAAVIQWNPDHTYVTLKEGTSRLVCYDRSGEPGRQPFAVQCTSVGNLDRVAQNRRFEAESENGQAMQAMLDAAEADGTRVKPEYGSVWISMNGPDQASRQDPHDDRRTGRHHRVNRVTRPSRGGWRVDHGCGNVHRPHYDTGSLSRATSCRGTMETQLVPRVGSERGRVEALTAFPAWHYR